MWIARRRRRSRCCRRFGSFSALTSKQASKQTNKQTVELYSTTLIIPIRFASIWSNWIELDFRWNEAHES